MCAFPSARHHEEALPVAALEPHPAAADGVEGVGEGVRRVAVAAAAAEVDGPRLEPVAARGEDHGEHVRDELDVLVVEKLGGVADARPLAELDEVGLAGVVDDEVDAEERELARPPVVACAEIKSSIRIQFARH